MRRASIVQLIIAFVVAFALLIGIGILGYQQNSVLVHDANLVAHTQQVLARLAEVKDATDIAHTQAQLAAVNHNPESITAVRSAFQRVAPALAELRDLTSDNPNEQQRLEQLDVLVTAQLAQLELPASGMATTVVSAGNESAIDGLIQDMHQEEQDLLDARITQSAASAQRAQQLIGIGSILGILIGLGTASVAVLALRARDFAMAELAVLNHELDQRVHQQTAELHEANDQLAALSHRLLVAQEDERVSVAQVLHESIGQDIAAVQLGLQLVDDLSTDPQVRDQLHQSMAAVDDVLLHIRTLSQGLRPSVLDDFGLPEALQTTVAPLADQFGTGLTIHAERVRTRPPADVETACFRIAQDGSELLITAIGTRSIDIYLGESPQGFELALCGHNPNGTILSPAAHGMALALVALRERAVGVGGSLDVRTTATGESWIVAHFPHSHAIQ